MKENDFNSAEVALRKLKVRLMLECVALFIVVFAMCATLFGCGTAQIITTEESVEAEDEEIERRAATVETLDASAHIISTSHMLHKSIALVFEGATSEATYIKLIDLLDKYNASATFYVSGITAAELPETLQLMVEHGNSLGNYALNGETHMEELSTVEMVRSLYRTQRIIMGGTGVECATARCNVSEYTDTLLKSALAAGVSNVVTPTSFVNHVSFKTEAQAQSFAAKTVYGSIVSVKLGQYLDESEYEAATDDLDERPAVDMTPTIAATAEPSTLPEDEDERLLLTLEWLIKAYGARNIGFVTPEQLDFENDISLATDYAEELLSADNAVPLEAAIDAVPTTKKSVALVIRDFADDETMYSILDALDAQNAHANFVVTSDELLDRKELISEIVARGHYLANGGFSGNSLDHMNYNDICREIVKGAKLMETEYGVSNAAFVPAFAYADETVLQACANRGVIPYTYNRHPRSDYNVSASDAMSYFSHGINRGDIIEVSADSMKQTADFCGLIANKVHDTGYECVSLDALYEGRYEVVPPEEIEGYYAAQINTDYDENTNNSAYSIDRIPVPSDEKVAFITFDDFGGDKTITKILDTLEKYDVKATFFLRAAGVELNPNLARAISDGGHDVCNHTYSHPVITTIAPDELQNEVVRAHQVITAAIGRCPEMYFRPPTLANDKTSTNAVLATGYEYILQATISTQDYERSADEVIAYALENANNGCMIILHLTDNSSGADALGALIEGLWEKGFTLKKVSDYLQ